MPNVSYPLDVTGLDPANLIPDELHTLTEVNNTSYRLLIPEFSPFYLDNFELKHTDDQGNVTILNEGVDFMFVLPYLAGSRSIGKMLYGGVSINTIFINGNLSMTYQTLGGDWIADRDHVLQVLAEFIYNPRITAWDTVTDKTDLFPPINHDQSLDYVFGHEELINAINETAASILSGPHLSESIIQALTGTQVNEGISRAEMYYYSKI